MVDIEYTEHLRLRLIVRKIPADFPKIIYLSPDQKFLDVSAKNFIAIKKLKYNEKLRNIMIAYQQNNAEVRILTIHPISEEKIVNRIISGRWIRNE